MAGITGLAVFFQAAWAAIPLPTWLLKMAPLNPSSLQWATYFDAADQAGLSRHLGRHSSAGR